LCEQKIQKLQDIVRTSQQMTFLKGGVDGFSYF